MTVVCPSWQLILQSRTTVHGLVDAPWQYREASQALRFLINRIHGIPGGPPDVYFSNALGLFYLAEAFNWLGKPQHISFDPMPVPLSSLQASQHGRKHLCPIDIQRLLDRMVENARGLYNVENWQLLGAVANRFDLKDREAAIRRAVDIRLRLVDDPLNSPGYGLNYDEEKVLNETDILSRLFGMHWISCS